MEENKSDILLYQAEDGSTKIQVRLQEDTVWLTQAQLCELFQKSKATISEHIKNIFQEGELTFDSVVRNFRTTAEDGKSYDTNFYNLDVIISVGYRVKSLQYPVFKVNYYQIPNDKPRKAVSKSRNRVPELNYYSDSEKLFSA